MIKEQLGEIGIRINVREVNSHYFNRYIENKNYELILTGSIKPLYPDLSKYFGRGNMFNFYNEEMFDLLKEINLIENIASLGEKYDRIIQIYNEEMPFISLYFSSNILIMNNRVRGLMDHNWHNIFHNISKWYKVVE